MEGKQYHITMTKIEQAKQFAHDAHDSINQKRKYSGEPYWVHTDEVADIVAKDGGDEDMIIAAHLHDVLEDVFPVMNGWNFSRIEATFGSRAASFVLELTDVFTKEAFPDLNRRERKHRERERLGNSSPESKTIKLADLISNTASIVKDDKDFAVTYLREKMALLPHLADGSPRLLQIASMQALAGMTSLGISIPTLTAAS